MNGMVGRKEQGMGEGQGGRGGKGRLIQERDRWALVLVGMNRVVREKTIRELVFPGRDEATFGNRAAELARVMEPVGAYWRVHRRMLENGLLERYVSLTDVGYRQAETVLGSGWFARRPTEELRPSHVAHDLELADFALSLFPRRTEEYQRRYRGKPAGPPVLVHVLRSPERWRWYHASVFDRLTVIRGGTRDMSGRLIERPNVALSFDPDAILETDSFNCTRYFIEWDRGTEPLVGAKERSTIVDKYRRYYLYFWASPVPPGAAPPGPHWAQRRSYYIHAFEKPRLRRPKALFITRSAKRAEHMWQLAKEYFERRFPGPNLVDFLEVLTVEQAKAKLHGVVRNVEQSTPPAEMPWVSELRRAAVVEGQGVRGRATG